MNGIWNAFREFRGSHLASILATILLMLIGLYYIIDSTDTINLVIGAMFLIGGILNLLDGVFYRN
ncbi:hypothetical protein C451_05278 [Halococcus thailandensis JCM 13552]|uniref:Uncharacterized protein n=1 Tax=Halococcus thailandensis JCM 13552 TaxID=1227457 RepID=M0NEU3_9EURY|nr:hypothetical protein C451_05278 [Halococcus thailandensis JCM 13552]